MSAQVTAVPGDSKTYPSGSIIVAEPGVSYRIADVAPDGSVGPTLTPPDVEVTANQPSPGDLSVRLPDGTLLVFQGLIALFSQGSGLAGGDGSLVVDSLEDLIEPAAGGDAGGRTGGDDAGGSSQAVDPAELGPLGQDFGSADGGGPSAATETGDDGADNEGGGIDDESDPSLNLLTQDEPTTTAPTNGPPTAEDDEGTTEEDTPLVVPAPAGLLANDSDPDGDPLMVTAIVDDPNLPPGVPGTPFLLVSGALLTVNVDGSYTYDPNGQFIGLGEGGLAFDEVTYIIDDGLGGTDSATLTITIVGVGESPTPQAEADGVLAEALGLGLRRLPPAEQDQEAPAVAAALTAGDVLGDDDQAGALANLEARVGSGADGGGGPGLSELAAQSWMATGLDRDVIADPNQIMS